MDRNGRSEVDYETQFEEFRQKWETGGAYTALDELARLFVAQNKRLTVLSTQSKELTDKVAEQGGLIAEQGALIADHTDYLCKVQKMLDIVRRHW